MPEIHSSDVFGLKNSANPIHRNHKGIQNLAFSGNGILICNEVKTGNDASEDIFNCR